ncbi:binding-protein-dependent transport systems inner membrane component [Halorhabdus utahensis DSM 12940]|uniref:Binding-protein-dependent transport systems inner membrane component n=1 Tax=Halorhabdus utahensis (strain DSM 12940 / JCM 11049 / AX-2) TaxID=519442 RepID=C7NPJ4_HALUD|nr:ABC transporter permease [Halorhabdus utahensis]ACV12749.1 binding-protein-dependent transport systems inner membrane component [Halorhabdus utahensis DSM 12940]
MKVSHSDSEMSTDELQWTYDAEDAVEVTLRDKAQEFYRNRIYEPGIVVLDDWRFIAGGLILLMYVLVATIGVWLVPYPEIHLTPELNLAPAFNWHSLVNIGGFNLAYPTFHDLSYPLGTTKTGRSIFGLLVHSTPKMMIMVISGGAFATIVATILGTVAGYKGGRVDGAISMFIDIAMTIPGLPLVMVLALAFQDLEVLGIGIGFAQLGQLPEPLNVLRPATIGMIIMINYWGGLGRAIRSQVLTLRQENYVEASRTMGVSTWKIILKDVIPNLMPYILINFVNAARFVVFSAVGLYFLGVLPTDVANWGVMISDAYGQGAIAGLSIWNWLFPPVFAMLFLALGLILLSQSLDRVFNPRVRTKLSSFDAIDSDEDDVEEVMNE